MKAPDKLYISKNIYGTFMYQVPNPDDKTEVEYIRADYIIDALRMEYEKGRADTIDKVCEFLKDRILHDSIDYPMATLHLIDDLKNYMEELQ